MMKQYFYDLTGFIQSQLAAGEDFTAWFAGEQSDFVRFNRGKIRQAGEVSQRYLTLRLLHGQKHVSVTRTLTGHAATDREQIAAEMQRLRGIAADVATDPHLLIATEPHSTERQDISLLPAAEAIVDDVTDTAKGHDLVGFLACGPIFNGFANSFGQRNWHETANFNLDWSLYAEGDKAVKSSYAGTEWSRDTFQAKFHDAATRLTLLRRPAKTIAPGTWRAYLTPSALSEVIGLLNWDGFSEKALRTKHSPLMQLADGGCLLHPAISMVENIAEGAAPAFQGEGFIKPDKIPLIQDGHLAGSLVSPRTAREYGIPTNGASSAEATESLQMDAGTLPVDQVLSELDTGLYISNLWYLNFSDRAAGRLTGMTRFATFWVQNGEIAAPLNVMRFDDSLYRMLGSQLAALTCQREFIVDTNTYGARHTGSRLLPGALLQELKLVL